MQIILKKIKRFDIAQDCFRYLFMILALVLFLTDVAVRKFKFKWPHEIVRAFRDKRKDKKGGTPS